MKSGAWRRLIFAAAPIMMAFASGCSHFWNPPAASSSSFTLSNSGNISVSPGSTSGNTSTITVSPASSFTGTVSLTCSVTSAPTGAISPATCSVSPASVSISSAAAQSATLTATTTPSTTIGTYDFKITGTSGSASQTTTLCAAVTTSSATCTPSPGNGNGGSGGSGNFYVLNQGTRQVVGYSIASGVLTNISGSPYTLSADPFSIAIAPNGNFLYVGTAAGIFLYTIQAGGQLTLANNLNAISQDIATTMQVDPSGQWLLEAGPNLKELLALPINTNTGVPLSTIEQFTLLPAATVQQLTVSPDNAHVFVALGSSGTQDVTFAPGQGSPFGSSFNIPTINSAGSALSVAVDPANPTSRLLYIGETVALSGSNTGGLRVFDYNTLTELPGSPFRTGGLSPVEILPLTYGPNTGKYVYVANRTVSGSSTGLIQGFSVASSGTTFSLTAMANPASAGIAPVGMVQESQGNYLLVVNSGGFPDLQAFTFDSTTPGKLDSALTSNTGVDPVQASGIAAAP
jgi:6-phosphogluconolactonase